MNIQGPKEKAAGIYYSIESLDRPIGEGGMGRVYAGMQVDITSNVKRPVAIKCIYDDLPERVIERAKREANIHVRNDNVIEMLGYVETEEQISNGDVIKHGHVVSELLMGVSLADVLSGKTTDKNGTEVEFAKELLQLYQESREDFARKVCVCVLSGLMAIHDAGYIHRDIDPTNIMITHSRHIKIIDFGIAKEMSKRNEIDKGLTTAGKFMGKAEYAAPELAIGDLLHQDHRTDIYAVGIMLYQFLVGNVPFQGPDCDVLEKQIHDKLPLVEVKDKALRRIIAKACEKKQDRRYVSCAEMRVDLERRETPSKISGMTESFSSYISGVKKKYVVGAAIVVALVLAGVPLSQMFLNQKAVSHEDYTPATRVDDSAEVKKQIVEKEKMAQAAAERGMAHGEGYVEDLIEARNGYLNLKTMASTLKSKGISHKTYDDEILEIDKKLKAALDEMNEKAKQLKQLGEMEAAADFEERAIRISQAMNNK